jgi:hypothetical protein
MRLLHTETLILETPTDVVRPYAILSHRWLADREEVSFEDLQNMQVHPVCHFVRASACLYLPPIHTKEPTFPPNVQSKQGYEKFRGACEHAFRAGLEYIWIDTCCINKTSSAELSEAINSMYAWYQGSAVCYVYLHDVGDDEDLQSGFEKADWLQRGWTLQELIAPDNVYFFNKDWVKIGSKVSFAHILNKITHIRQDVLLGIPCNPSIAEKMSWAAERKTQKKEDRAYSLMGLFGIHMPIIYGEGEKAFRRLQLEIMKTSDDQTIFAWRDSLAHNDVRERGLLASTPDFFPRIPPAVTIDQSLFIDSLRIPGSRRPFPDLPRGYSILNDGIHITLPMKKTGDVWLAVLRCKGENQMLPYGIHLKERPDCGDFLRISPTSLNKIQSADLEDLVPRGIRMVVDHHILPTINRRQIFTFRFSDLVWEHSYHVCPEPGGCHDVGHGGGYQVPYPQTQIQLSDNVQCGCVYSRGPRGEITVILIGIEHHRPWVHLVTDAGLRQYVNSARRSTAIYDAHLVSSPTTDQADQFSSLAPSSPTSPQSNSIPPSALSTPRSPSSSRSLSLSHTFAGTHNHRFPKKHPTASNAQLRGGSTGCLVCSMIQKYSIDFNDIKNRRNDFAFESMSDKHIEVDIRKGSVCISEEILEVNYVITVAVVDAA